MGRQRFTKAVVTGAGSGLGRAFAVELHRRGASVLVSDVNAASAEETARMLSASTPWRACDVSQRAAVEALRDDAQRELGGYDLVINNAGVAVAGPIGQIAQSDWEWIMGVNLWGPIHGCEVFVPGLRAQGRGHVLNVASMAGLMNLQEMGPYNVTKAGVIALSETLYGELKGTGVTVSALCPSFFPTNIMKSGKAHDPRAAAVAAKLMEKSPFSAGDIARIALDASERGELFILPHAEGRAMWRAKRVMPEVFQSMLARGAGWVRKRATS